MSRKKKPDPFVINIRGTAEYREFLLDFLDRTQSTNPEITSITKLVVGCISIMAWKSFRMVAPPNSNPKARKRIAP